MSFVEKALNRLKQQEQPVEPLGQLAHRKPLAERTDTTDTSDTTGSSDADSGWALRDEIADPNTPFESGHAVKTVHMDRERLRDEGFLVPEEYRRQMADEYRRIKRPLIANAFAIGVPGIEMGNLILVTSALAGEGKTHTCINLALSLATERDRTVLLVDGDVPKPHISRLFGLAEEPGLLDALDESPPPLESMLVRTDIPRLAVLPAGRWREHATELLASERMRDLCKELAQRYPDRIVLFDSPPLLAAPESQAIGAAVGQVVLVVAENAAAREAVRSALALLDEQKPVNAILNKSRRPSQGGYYYGGYSYGARGEIDDSRESVPQQT